MAAGLAEKAEGRAASVVAAIRDHLRAGNGRGALHRAVRAVESEAAKTRRRDPSAGALLDAELAGILAGLAADLHKRRPVRPDGCPKVPRPDDLLAVCEDSLRNVLEGGGSDA